MGSITCVVNYYSACIIKNLTKENVNNRTLRKVWYIQDGDYEDMCLLGCEVSGIYVRKFRKNVLPISSG